MRKKKNENRRQDGREGGRTVGMMEEGGMKEVETKDENRSNNEREGEKGREEKEQ